MLRHALSSHADGDGRTPLIFAADRGQLDAVKMLLAKGAEIHAKVIAPVCWFSTL